MTPLKLVGKQPCGECTACCNALGVLELRKPYYVQCKHVCKSGCAIYPDRPDSCRSFECLYSSGVAGVGRPDRCGYVLAVDFDPDKSLFMEVLLVRDFTAAELERIIPHLRGIYRRVREAFKLTGGFRLYRNNAVVNIDFEPAPEYAAQYRGLPAELQAGRVFVSLEPEKELYFLDEIRSAEKGEVA